MMRTHLILTLEAPLMSFGGITIDHLGVTRDFPAASMLTGLLANALGWDRNQRQEHQELQERLVFAVRMDREPTGTGYLTDFQTAQLSHRDRGWTTRGKPEGRTGEAATYNSPHLRYREYLADASLTLALRLDPAGGNPALDQVQAALNEPARPLFIGRKPCIPAVKLLQGTQEGHTALDALLRWNRGGTPARVAWPAWEGEQDHEQVAGVSEVLIADERNWLTGLHGGERTIGTGLATARAEETI